MLKLNISPNESILIGEDIKVTVVRKLSPERVELKIEAGPEVLERIQASNIIEVAPKAPVEERKGPRKPMLSLKRS
ncbi:carbon storage regulator [Pseudomonas aeruginosa]